MRRMVLILLVPALLAPLTISAQQRSVQLTPTVGFNWSGSIDIEERAFRQRDYPVGIDGGGSYGLRLDFPMSDAFSIQLLALRQDTQLDDGQGLFGEDPSFIVPPGTNDLLDVDITYLHAGLVWHLTQSMYQPYLAASAGIGIVDPALSLESDEGFSVSVGGGLKMHLSERLGLLFDVRVLYIDTDATVSATDQFDHIDCTDPCTYTYRYQDDLTQSAVSFGLILKL